MTRKRRTIRQVILAACAGAAGLWLLACQSAQRHEPATPEPDPPLTATDPTAADQPAGMAADDADALHVKPGQRQPSRRPPEPRRRRAVDQPRIRP